MSAKPKIRLWVVGPCLAYLAVFFLWFPRWQTAPHSLSARVFGGLFLVMTAAWMIPVLLAKLWFGSVSMIGLRDVVELVTRVYETYFKKEEANDVDTPIARVVIHSRIDRPALVVTKRVKNGAAIRGACPLCDVEFSTEAFARDATYPHEQKLDEWYQEHLQHHIAAGETA